MVNSAGLRRRARYRQPVGSGITGLKIARAKPCDFGLPLRRSIEAGEVEETCDLTVHRKCDVVWPGRPPVGGYSAQESIDQAFGKGVEGE